MVRVQVMQAEAVGRKLMVCMNPILLKPTSHTGSQVIVNGEVFGNMSAREYSAYNKEEGVPICGICGWYQMMGRWIFDPEGAEEGGRIEGMGLLSVGTELKPEKIRRQVHGTINKLDGAFSVLSGLEYNGYEIHMEETSLAEKSMEKQQAEKEKMLLFTNEYEKGKGVSMIGIHGGDVYRNQVELDFSVNLNPLGMPKAVKEAIDQAADWCNRYPDPVSEDLKKAVGKMFAVPEEYLLFGNGASELFMAVVHGICPNKTVIPVPSFYGYEYAAKALEGEVIYYETKKESDFCLTEAFYQVLTKEVDLIFLANPNNPTGTRIKKEWIKSLLYYCKNRGIYVVLDECFIEFCGGEDSLLSEIEQFENLILIRTFTKIFSIPGVRLGYLICSNRQILYKIQRQLPEWNLSCFAQAAGLACAKQTEFIKQTVDYVKKEREFLKEELQKLKFLVFPSAANFLLVYSEELFYKQLQEHRILIRDCSNFRGLSKGFYRIAVKSREENIKLLKTIKEIKINIILK